MIVEMGTVAAATRVAALTGCPHLPAQQEGKPSRRVEVGGDFEAHRAAVESVSVLFRLFDGTQEVSSGWALTAARFEVEWPSDPSVVRSHFGARRYAYNWALGQVKADMDAKKENPDHQSVGWDPASLRKEWNHQKADLAPWWEDNSKEAYASGIADLSRALSNWKASKAGHRKGRKVGFPRFKSKARDSGRVRFTTGAMRLEEDRRTITLPVIGPLRSKENTRRVQRHLAKTHARILSMTLSERWGRLFVSVNHAGRTPVGQAVPAARAGVDLGLRTLATVSDTEGNIFEVPNPTPLAKALVERRRVGRQLSRRIPGSRGHRAARAKLARIDRRAVHLRQEAWHQTTTWLVNSYSEVVIEDLNLAAMKRSMGRRAFRRSVSDAALGMFRPMLSYKAQRAGCRVVVADRWYPSSQLHHGCGCRLEAPTRMAKLLVCQVSGQMVDRDRNAASNLRDWPGHASSGLVEASAPVVSSSIPRDGDAGSDTGTNRYRRSDRKTTSVMAVAGCSEARTNPVSGRGKNPERGAA